MRIHLRPLLIIGCVAAFALAHAASQEVAKLYFRVVASQNLREIILTPSNGYIVGDSGTILSSSDRGETWRRLSSGTTNDLLAATFANEKVGWVAGKRGTLLKTTDGGETWIPQHSGTMEYIVSLQFINADTGTLRTVSGFTATTTDGGVTWIASKRVQSLPNKHFDFHAAASKKSFPSAAQSIPLDANSIVHLSSGESYAVGASGAFWKFGAETGAIGLKSDLSLNGRTLIYTLAEAGPVTIRLFDASGRTTSVLMENKRQDAGTYRIPIGDFRSGGGISILVFQARNFRRTLKFVN